MIMSKISPDQYINEGHANTVLGAISITNLQRALLLSQFQEKLGIKGSIAEIGVLGGRFFILLSLIARGYPHIAIDVFDSLEDNFDASGGAIAFGTFSNTYTKFLGQNNINNLVCIAKDSIDVFPNELHIATNNTGIRFFSIDGAHSAHHTTSDLFLADSTLCSGGIAVLDDITNAGWPGVMEGLSRFLLLSPFRRLVPFLITENKIWLTTHSHHDAYLNYCNNEFIVNPPYEKRISDFFGAKILGY